MNTSTPLIATLGHSAGDVPDEPLNDGGPVVSYMVAGLALIYMLLV